jgi:hypothetical protein
MLTITRLSDFLKHQKTIILFYKISSIFNGPVADLIQKIVNGDLPGPLKHFTSIIAIVVS